ncbi:hypothetical protein CSB45_04250 [candidate division KSB3 bacterium]|uniref:Uncharacterized protein n=1 Tax=candidate division KSB3 bacterium TaxID=2044937 RepID=A0A2G6E883_9BACT|nr:MAG: hypothetical protein CSB45_04250 [candidate division KSB3 bacterium]PIE30590.1 MAG: hypothetical protein CSA57_02835 [candidate division KSB3 bacterium]
MGGSCCSKKKMRMRVFLSGKEHQDWRGEISDFLTQQHIDCIDPMSCPPEFSSLFKQLKTLESCDLLIANFLGLHNRQLLSILEISYASKLAKEIIIVDDISLHKEWLERLPYSKLFVNLEEAKCYLDTFSISGRRQARFFG